jgi:hypothetical protein
VFVKMVETVDMTVLSQLLAVITVLSVVIGFGSWGIKALSSSNALARIAKR